MINPMLSIRDLVCGYPPSDALFAPLSFDCYEGEIIAILGANGQGKTTLLHALAAIHPALSGQIERTCHIGFVPQLFSPAFSYRVMEIVLMGRTRHIGLFSAPNRQDYDIARDMLTLLEIEALADRRFDTLSGGQRQLVLIARALASQCRILILDEPTAALDLNNQSLALRLMTRLAKEQGLCVIFTTHDPAHAQAVADRALLLMPDKSYLFGASNSVLTERHLSRLYGLPIRSAVVEGMSPPYRTLVPVHKPCAEKEI
jgi:iron complex transport system ATP-binding protein